MFNSLSYVEFRTHDGQYVSRFPSEKTTAGVMPKTRNVFLATESSTAIHVRDVMESGIDPRELMLSENLDLVYHIIALAKNSFIFTDFYWFLDPKEAGSRVIGGKTIYDAPRIKEWMESLYYEEKFEMTPYHVKCTMRSTINPTFSLSCYVTSSSLPQEAIDSIPVCRDSSGFRVILGKRAVSPCVVVMDGKIEIEVKGMPGYVLYGEHLLPEKKRQIEELYNEFLKTDKEFMKISTQDASEALRAIYEEGGLKIDGQIDAYMLKKDDAPGRDARYWTYGSRNQYGYKRVSSSYNILLVIPSIDTLPEPIDTIECQKGVIVSIDIAMEEFRENGKFPTVFPCHARQLKIARNVLLDF